MTSDFQVHLADRTLMPGDVVRRMIKGKDTQRGYCRDIELTACVQVIGTKQVLTDIKSEDLIPLQVCGYSRKNKLLYFNCTETSSCHL